MRDKEGKQDYRFMPEPNLPPLVIYDNDSIHKAPNASHAVNIDAMRQQLPELPEQQRARLVKNYSIKLESAIKLVVSHQFTSGDVALINAGVVQMMKRYHLRSAAALVASVMVFSCN